MAVVGGKSYVKKLWGDIRASEQRTDYLHQVYEVFDHQPVCFDDAGYGSPTGSTGDENRIITAQGNYFEYHIVGGGQSIVAPVFGANGLNIALDQGNAEGMEMSQGITARSQGAFVIGTAPAFRLKVQASIADADGAAEFAVGFRLVEAYQALIDNYDEMACLNALAGVFNIETILNGGSTVTTDTTETDWDDGETHSFTVKVSAGGVVTFEIDDAAPTVTASFTFDTDDVVIPFLYFMHSSELAGEVNLKLWDCGYDRSVP